MYRSVVAKTRPSVRDAITVKVMASPPSVLALQSSVPEAVATAHSISRFTPQPVKRVVPKLSSAGARTSEFVPVLKVHSSVGASVVASKESARTSPFS